MHSFWSVTIQNRHGCFIKNIISNRWNSSRRNSQSRRWGGEASEEKQKKASWQSETGATNKRPNSLPRGSCDTGNRLGGGRGRNGGPLNIVVAADARKGGRVCEVFTGKKSSSHFFSPMLYSSIILLHTFYEATCIERHFISECVASCWKSIINGILYISTCSISVLSNHKSIKEHVFMREPGQILKKLFLNCLGKKKERICAKIYEWKNGPSLPCGELGFKGVLWCSHYLDWREAGPTEMKSKNHAICWVKLIQELEPWNVHFFRKSREVTRDVKPWKIVGFSNIEEK